QGWAWPRPQIPP
uniref:Bradykinin-potentiating peptide 12a n=1 Tax=Bothrops jararaca TaxID=8724 RepID=BPPCA_BOTJA|nr:RecName: Full=Bradykinin-potentiating peptide 12a; Short=BPP-12a [Bothrops jararaca]